MIFFGIFLLVLIIYTLLVFSVKAANILENIFTDSIDKTRIKEAAQANLFEHHKVQGQSYISIQPKNPSRKTNLQYLLCSSKKIKQ